MTLNLCDDLNIKTKICYHMAQRVCLSLYGWTHPATLSNVFWTEAEGPNE